jgi:acetyl-CoA acyltransferase
MTAIGIVGVGTSKFGKYVGSTLTELAAPVIDQALHDAGLAISDIDMAFVSNGVASITTGQVAVVGQSVLRPLGFSNIPVYNVENACAGSSSAVSLAVQALRSGAATTVLVLGVEKMYAESREDSYRALNGAADVAFVKASGVDIERGSVFVTAIYPVRLGAYRDKYGLEPVALATLAAKNRAHAVLNPDAQFTTPVTVEEVLESRVVVDPITMLMCAPLSDGASALIVTTARNVRDDQRPIWVRSAAVGMGAPASDESSVSRVAARAFAEAGITPGDIDVAELHDSIAFNELIAYEEIGFCEPGGGSRLALDGVTALGGRMPVNTSGGLESRGHPMSATGASQITELVRQLRGEAGARQVPNARFALAENAGGFAVDDTAAIAITILSDTPGT